MQQNVRVMININLEKLKYSIRGKKLEKEKIKCICSCIRNESTIIKALERPLLKFNDNPKSGDIVVVEVLDSSCGYPTVENMNGRNVTVYDKDILIGVLGSRKSGTNIYGAVPESKINAGDTLEILAQGGLIGLCIHADSFQRKTRAMPVKVLGFVQGEENKVENIINFVDINDIKIQGSVPTIVIFGTSAEAGKTTLMCNMLNTLKKDFKMRVGCIKVCGTGRYKDLLAYKDAGADLSADFVDFGLVSTYDLQTDEYIKIVEKMYDVAKEKVEILLIEVGGDLLEGNADTFLKISKEKDYHNILIVNDAMGGKYGIKLFGENGLSIFSWKQNPYSLKKRLKKEEVFTFGENDIKKFLKSIFESNGDSNIFRG